MMDKKLLHDLNVSRETLSRLEVFAQVLRKWNPKINLVSRSSLDHLWTRHIADSIQVFRCIESPDHWVDIGSGGGFPGLIVAIVAAEEVPQMKVTLIESDTRKSAFLRTAARECGVTVEVLTQRIEEAEAQKAGVLSARALSDLTQLLDYASIHLGEGGTALFPKGGSWKKEVDNAKLQWQFEVEPVRSLTEAEAVILKIWGAVRV